MRISKALATKQCKTSIIAIIVTFILFVSHVFANTLDATLSSPPQITDKKEGETSQNQADDTHNFDWRVSLMSRKKEISILIQSKETGQVELKHVENYRSFYKKAELSITQFDKTTRIDLGDRAINLADHVEPGASAQIALRFYDEQGRFDQTAPISIIIDTTAKSKIDIHQSMNLEIDNIRLNAKEVKLIAKNLAPKSAAKLNQQLFYVNDAGELDISVLTPVDQQTVSLEYQDNQAQQHTQLKELTVPNSQFFNFGMLDVTYGRSQTSLTSSSNLNEVVKDARAGFYSNGVFSNGYQLIAMVDSQEVTISDLFSTLSDRTNKGLLKRLDDSQNPYAAYGDGGALEQTAPTEGKLFAKLQKYKNYGMWGSFNAQSNTAQPNEISRSLYGAKGHYESEDTTTFGEAVIQATGFIADPDTIQTRDQFRGTGGSVYFLSYQNITSGSEKIRLEYRDATTGLVKQTQSLTYGQDYEIDYVQGRILLSRPLSAWANSTNSVVSQAKNEYGDSAFLVVDYEAIPSTSSLAANRVVGGDAQTWLNDYVKLGVSNQHQRFSTGPSDDSKSIYMTLRKTERSLVNMSVTQTSGTSSLDNQSDNGGYSVASNAAVSGDKSNAINIDGMLDVRDFNASAPVVIKSYYKSQEAGFTGLGYQTPTEAKQYGVALKIGEKDKNNQGVIVDVKADFTDQTVTTKRYETDVTYEHESNWFGTIGIAKDIQSASAAGVSDTGNTTLGVRLGKHISDKTDVYAFGQDTMSTQGSAMTNNRYGLGTKWRATDKLSVIGEAARNQYHHNSANIKASYEQNKDTHYYAGYDLNSADNNGVLAQSGTLVAGGEQRLTEKIDVYAEQTRYQGELNNGVTHTLGVRLSPRKDLSISAGIELGNVNGLDRKAFNTKLTYKTDKNQGNVGFEYRHEDDGLTDRIVQVIRARNDYAIDNDFSLITKLNRAHSTTAGASSALGNFTDATIGLAYRPTTNNKLNTLATFTYHSDLPTDEQIANGVSSYKQVVHVAAIDAIYDLNKLVSLGAKYAYKHGGIDSGSGWVDTRTSLTILRTDWKITSKWDALFEYRILHQLESKTKQTGFLSGLYYRVSQNIKVGAGYNWSHFSDDITMVKQDAKGWFVNAVGSF